MEIPAYLDTEDYLQNPIMRRFLKDRNQELPNSRPDYIRAIEDYANKSKENEIEVHQWLLKILKEGSKEFWYRKIYPNHNVCDDFIQSKLDELYPDCPMLDTLEFNNSAEQQLTTYSIELNNDGSVKKINLSYSRLCYYGKDGDTTGEVTVFPIFAEVYLDTGFIVCRCKAKSTLYDYDPANAYLDSSSKVDIAIEAERIIDLLTNAFEFEYEDRIKVNKCILDKMLYKIYDLYSFTPEDVQAKVESQSRVASDFIEQVFSNLSLDGRNKSKALIDINIFIEKFLSINGDNEHIFKNDRDAYLINISTDDDTDLTRIDTTSIRTVPLQCTEAFYDSKKSVVRSKQCKKLRLVFKRNDTRFFGTPLVVQLCSHKGYGNIKTLQYAEEEDIQNVLQTIFRNY